MRRLGVLLLLVLLVGQVSVVYAQYPRHVDPAMYEVVEPDPDMLFLIYHYLYMGMLLENITIQEEWLQWVMEFYSMEDLNLLFEEYGELLRYEGSNLNLTRFHFNEAIRYVGVLDIPAARSSFFQGLVYLKQSNETIPLLRETTGELGRRLSVEPSILYEDIDGLQGLVDEYAGFAQLLVDYLERGELSDDDLERIKDALGGVVDDEVLDELREYLDSLGGVVDTGSVIRTSLSLELNASSAWVGGSVVVSGRLSAGGIGLNDRVIAFIFAGVTESVTTVEDGFYSVVLGVPYIYEDSLDIRGLYWPKGGDTEVYSPATAVEALELLYSVPVFELKYSESALPGLGWNISGSLSHGGEALPGFRVGLGGFGKKVSGLTGEAGMFSLSVLVPFDQSLGGYEVVVSSEPRGVFAGVSERVLVDVVRVPLELVVEPPGWVFSGFPARIRYRVVAGGVELDRCMVRVVGEDGSGVDYSIRGGGVIGLNVSLWRLGGEYGWRLVADPVEPWVSGAGASGCFHVVNTVVALLEAVLAGVGVVYLRRYLIDRGSRVEVDAPVAEPVVEPVAEPVEPAGFSGLFMVALRIVEGLSGVVMAPCDTLREYLGRVVGGFGGRLCGLFGELVARYELWLYGRPHEPELERVMVLVAGLEEAEDEG